jgi:hypothetical protein
MTARAALFVFVLVALSSQSTRAQTDFSSHWHDGRAEIDGYRLTVERYGQPRTGHAVLVYVTEPFSASGRVKVDDPARNPADTVDVLKLNLIRDFQTGIYDYNTMTSVFSESGGFSPMKISFSSAEWCGHLYEELLFDAEDVTARHFSYFEGESSQRVLSRTFSISEDNLFIRLRGLRGPYLQPGVKLRAAYLPGAFYRRLTHRKLEWTRAEIERRPDPEVIEVPAGAFTTVLYVVKTDWEWGPGPAAETAELTGTIRVKYWQLNANGDERYLEQLGLTEAPPQE